MVEQILDEFEFKIDSITLVPGKGGVFEVMAGDTLVYSKKETGEHAEYEDVAPGLRKLLD